MTPWRNFAFIRDYYADDPQALVDLTKECGVDLVNLYGHFTFDVEEAIRIAKEQIDFCAAVGVKWYNCQNAGFGDDGPSERPTNPRCWTRCATWPTPWAPTPRRRASPCASTPTTAPACSGRATSITSPSTPIPTTSPSALTPPHTTLAGMDPAALIRQYGSRVAYMHLKDVDTYALSKAEGRDKMGTFRALGHGTVNFPAVKAALEEVGFDGVLCVELDRPEVCNFHSAEVSRIYLRDVLGI